MALITVELSFVIYILNIITTHMMLTRTKSALHCIIVFAINSLLIYVVTLLAAQNIHNAVVLKYVLFFIVFLYFGYINYVFSESTSKKIFTMFTIWIYSIFVFYIAIVIMKLCSGYYDEKYMTILTYLVRIGFQISILPIIYFYVGKYYKKLFEVVPNKTMAVMSIYPIAAFLLLVSKFPKSYDNLKTINSLFDDTSLILFVVLGYLTVFVGISASSKLELQHYMANHDSSLGIANRTNIMNQLAKTIDNSVRGNYKFALLIYDLDYFKNINDKYGHLAGDKALKNVAETVKKVLRSTDSIGRWGGDEFVIIQQYVKDESDVEMLIKRIIEELKKPFIVDGKAIPVDVSIGASIFPDYALNRESLINQADKAMYEAKKREGCTFNIFKTEKTEE